MTDMLRDALRERAMRAERSEANAQSLVGRDLRVSLDEIKNRAHERSLRRRSAWAAGCGVVITTLFVTGAVTWATSRNQSSTSADNHPAMVTTSKVAPAAGSQAAASSTAPIGSSARLAPRLGVARPAPTSARFSLGIMPKNSHVESSNAQSTLWVTGTGAKLAVGWTKQSRREAFPLTLAGYPARYEAPRPKFGAGTVLFHIGKRYAIVGGSTNLQLSRDEMLTVAGSLKIRDQVSRLPATIATSPERRAGIGPGQPAGSTTGLVRSVPAAATAPASFGLVPTGGYRFTRHEPAVVVYDGPGKPSAEGGQHFLVISIEKYNGVEADYPDTAGGFPARLSHTAKSWAVSLKYNATVTVQIELHADNLTGQQVLAMIAALDLRDVSHAGNG